MDISRYQRDYDEAFAVEQAMIQRCISDKAALPDHYWQNRFGAQRRLEVAKALKEIVDEL